MASFIPDTVCEFTCEIEGRMIGFHKEYPYRIMSVKVDSKKRPISIRHAQAAIKRLQKQINAMEKYIKQVE